MSPRVLIAAGGTGGHIFPGVAVAREWQRRDPQVKLLFVGTARGLETRVIPQEGFELELIEVSALNRVGLKAMLRGLWMLPRSFIQSLNVLRRFQPDLVIGVGGYAAGPIMLMAILKRIPTLIIEPNAYPGFTNRVLARWVRAAAVGFAEAAPYFHGKAVVTGNPVRPEFFRLAGQPPATPESAQSPFHLLIVGGSQGAHALNLAAIAALPLLLPTYDQLTVVHQTGERDLAMARAAYESLAERERVHVRPFIHPLADELARAHFVVCRAGAITLAELAAAGKPALLVPLPTAANDHQRRNAEAMARRGAARCILQSELTPERLVVEIAQVIEHRDQLAAMAAAMRQLAHADAAQKIVALGYEAMQPRPAKPASWLRLGKSDMKRQQDSDGHGGSNDSGNDARCVVPTALMG